MSQQPFELCSQYLLLVADCMCLNQDRVHEAPWSGGKIKPDRLGCSRLLHFLFSANSVDMMQGRVHQRWADLVASQICWRRRHCISQQQSCIVHDSLSSADVRHECVGCRWGGQTASLTCWGSKCWMSQQPSSLTPQSWLCSYAMPPNRQALLHNPFTCSKAYRQHRGVHAV